MNEQNLPDLPQQLASLQKVLRNVIEQNEALKAENSVLRALIAANTTTHSQVDGRIEAKHLPYSTVQSSIEANQLTDSLAEQGIAAKQLSHSQVDERMEAKQLTYSAADTRIEVKQVYQGSEDSSTGMSDSAYTLPARLEVSPQNVGLLATALLSQGLCNGKHQTALTAAKLIIHFYNEQPGEYKYLRRLTGYSAGGLGKMLMMLRRKGCLLKSGYQQHAVAANGIQALMQAQCK